ncbi:MAG: YIP1 family protein [Promethearchaeota archaeon]
MSNDGSETTPKFCGNCGQKLLGGATFCAYCGTPVPTVDSTGVVSTKPSSPYTAIPPTVSDRGTPTYPPSYRPERIVREPPLPFAQHFQGVLMSPKLEMPRIVKRPNLGQPFIIVLIAGIISGLALYVLTLRTPIEFSEGFFESLGISGMDIDMDEYMQFLMIVSVFFTPFGFFITWLIGSFVLWILQAIFSSQVPSHERNFKTMMSIVGWSFLPRIFSELLRLAAFALFIQPTTITINDIFDFTALSAPIGIVGDILFFTDIIFLIWGIVLVYFAVKSIDPEGSHAVIIAIIYAVILFIVG